MGVLKYTITGCVGIGLTIAGCTQNNPASIAEPSLSFSISAAAAAIKPPEELIITVTNDFGYHRRESVMNPGNTGNMMFPGVPYGFAYVDIQGVNGGIRSLYGFSSVEIQGPGSMANVMMRKILSIKNLRDDQEQLFLQNIAMRSEFWNAVPEISTVSCTAPDGRPIMKTTIASAPQNLYFLFEITDTLFSNEDRPANGAGEFTADAVIIYLCKLSPNELKNAARPLPAVRFQCEVGRTVPENGNFNFVNFASGDVRNNIISSLKTNEFNGRIFRSGVNQRTLELRINKNNLALPPGAAEYHQFSIVIRYRNSDGAMMPMQLCDWQNGQAESDPKMIPDVWGYLEVNP